MQIYAKALLDMGVSIRQVARKTDLCTTTIQVIKRQQDYSPFMLDQFKKRLPFKAYQLADDVLDLIDRDEIKKAPLGTKMMAFGVAIDKARDMEGSNRPVFNISNIVMDAQRTLTKLDAQLSNFSDSITEQKALTENAI
jgi:hypothetical protein